MPKEIRSGLAELGFKPNEIKVYLALTRLGEATAAEIAAKAELPRTTAISLLEKLSAEGYLTGHARRGVMRYWVESPQAIVEALATKLKVASALADDLTGLYRSEAFFPYATVCDTRESIKRFIDKFLASQEKRSVLRTIDTPAEDNYGKVVSERVGDIFFGKKNDRGILTRSLVPAGSFAGIDARKLAAQSIEVRELPPGLAFSGSLWLTDKMLVHFSGNPPFLVALRHGPIVAGMSATFESLWRISSPKK